MNRVEAPWFRTPLFGLVAPSLGWAPPIRFLLRRSRVLKLMGKLNPGRLLEVGCGAGALLDEFSLMGYASTGFETSAKAVAMGRSIAAATGGQQILVTTSDPAWLGAFDLVCAFDVLEHVADDAGALAQWTQWMRSGGRICISVPAHQSRWGAGDEWAGHYRRYEKRDLLALLESSGLEIEHLECYGFPLAVVTEWLGNRTYRRLMKERARALSSAEASAESGVERSDYLRLFRWMNTVPGRMALRASFLLQAMSARSDLGSGYLALARKP